VSALLEVSGLAKRFGELRVLEGIDLSVAARGVHSIIGPNGAGKTTLFNCITGVVKPESGSVTLAGRDITRLAVVPRVRLGLVRTFQVSRVFDTLSARENVELALQKTVISRGDDPPEPPDARLRPAGWVKGKLGFRLTGAARRGIDARCRELLAETGLAAASLEVPSGTLSHADRRAVEVAMALACDPVVLCLDEPTAGIGAGEAERMTELIGRLGERLSVLLIEHRMSLVQQVSQQVSVLAFGQLIAQGTPGEVAADPRVQEAYLGRAAASQPDAPSRSAVTPPLCMPTVIHNGVANGDLALRDVHAYYGSSHALHGVSLTARQGQVTGVLGRNGAGKTTTMAAITGLVRARAGSIMLGSRELTRMSTHAIAGLGVGLVPEHRWVFPDLTVEENLRVAAGSRGSVREAYLEFPALAERREAKGSQLSGGQQQMVALARTLVRGAQVVLLDEPTQGLSPMYVEVVVGYVRKLRERGVTVVLVEQSIDVVAAVADTVYLMRDGEIAAQIAAAELGRDHPLVQETLLLEPGSQRAEEGAVRE
jgi:branched-chain amino acid transport system ATP-binding protein